MCKIFPIKCEVRRENDVRKTLQIIQCKGVGVGEPSRSYKQSSINIHICLILEAGIHMLGIRVDSKPSRRPIHYGCMRIMNKGMSTRDTMWIHTSMT
jgi:hypothetical protein